MKSANRILVVFLIISLFGAILTFKYFIDGIYLNGAFAFNFNLLAYLGAFFLLSTLVLSTVFYVKFLKMQPYGNFVFFVTLPITLIFMSFSYFLIFANQNNAQDLQFLKVAFRIDQTNDNLYWWLLSGAILYLLFLFFAFNILSRPLKKVQKATNRLSYGIVKDKILIGGNRQFKDIEFALNKINQNYKEDASTIKQTNSEVEKFIPKQFLKFFGVSNILDLDLGNKVQKEVTTMFCDIRDSMSISSSLSLEENFNFINAYLNLISPLIRRYNGFVDKYLGDGIMAVFQKPEHALECSKSIFSAIAGKNFKTKNLPRMKVGISIHTGEVVFGVVGEESRKSLTILSDGVSLAGKLQEINEYFGTFVIFSKRTLNALPYGFSLNYRYIGTLKHDDVKGENFSVFEDIDIYSRIKREKLVYTKKDFEQAVRFYDGGDFASAKSIFASILKNIKEDKVAYIYFNLCDEKLKIEKIDNY